jgi:hypothetical protein
MITGITNTNNPPTSSKQVGGEALFKVSGFRVRGEALFKVSGFQVIHLLSSLTKV